jgi:hypothetical protein
MPSSRPMIFIIDGKGEDAEAAKAELSSELESMGLTHPEVIVSATGENHVLVLKTYITKDRIAVKEALADHDRFRITQELWLTPELEIWIDNIQETGE